MPKALFLLLLQLVLREYASWLAMIFRYTEKFYLFLASYHAIAIVVSAKNRY